MNEPLVEAASEVLQTLLFYEELHLLVERSGLWLELIEHYVDRTLALEAKGGFVVANGGGTTFWIHVVVKAICSVGNDTYPSCSQECENRVLNLTTVNNA